MSRAWLLGCILCLVACSDSSPIEVSVPLDVIGAESALVLVEQLPSETAACGKYVRAHGVELDGTPLGLAYEYEQAVRVAVVYFDRPLSEVGLVEGDVLQRLKPKTPECRVTHLASKELRVTANGPGEFVDASSTPSVDCFCFDAPQSCTDFAIDVIPTADGSPDFVVNLDQSHVFVSYGIDEWFIIDGVSDTPVAVPNTMISGGAALKRSDGRFWLTGKQGDVWHARVGTDGSYEPIEHSTTSTTAQEMGWLASLGSDDRLLAMSYGDQSDNGLDARIERWDGTGWELLREVETPADSISCGDMVQLTTGEVLAARGGGPEVWSYKDGSLSDMPAMLGIRSAVCALAEVPGLGVVAATSQGEFFRRDLDGGAWTPMPDSGFSLGVWNIKAYGDGFVWGGMRGQFGQWDNETQSFCPARLLGSGDIYVMDVLGEQVFAASSRTGSDDLAAVHRLTPR